MPRLAHDLDALTTLRTAVVSEPLRLLVSGCMLGQQCGIDGTDYGMGDVLGDLTALPTVRLYSFCPEDFGLGTPRSMPDIHGGDGFDVLDGTASVLDPDDNDLTAGMLKGAQAMLEFAKENAIELAILTDMSGACGSQVISDGCRLVSERRYRAGVGVATALLLRNGFLVVSQRDFRTLNLIRKKLGASATTGDSGVDHHESAWYHDYFALP